jgi:hypothetical protein
MNKRRYIYEEITKLSKANLNDSEFVPPNDYKNYPSRNDAATGNR